MLNHNFLQLLMLLCQIALIKIVITSYKETELHKKQKLNHIRKNLAVTFFRMTASFH
jgi:hypothetical protein